MGEEILLVVHSGGKHSSELLFPEEDTELESVEKSAFLLQFEHVNLSLIELAFGNSLVFVLFQGIENVLDE